MAPQRASEILARRRPLTLKMIQTINARWKIPADLLLQLYRVAATAARERLTIFRRFVPTSARANSFLWINERSLSDGCQPEQLPT